MTDATYRDIERLAETAATAAEYADVCFRIRASLRSLEPTADQIRGLSRMYGAMMSSMQADATRKLADPPAPIPAAAGADDGSERRTRYWILAEPHGDRGAGFVHRITDPEFVGARSLKCDGSSHTAAHYPALHELIGTRHGGSGALGSFCTPIVLTEEQRDYHNLSIGILAATGLDRLAKSEHLTPETRERLAAMHRRAEGRDRSKRSAESGHARLLADLDRVEDEVRSKEPVPVPIPVIDRALLDAALAELDGFVGLEGLKSRVRGLVRFLEVQARRRELGADAPVEMTHHLVFHGPPGTGKTSVARVMGKIYHALGILESDRVVEADREALVGRYIGETAKRTNKLVDDALGGVLFIDEAYTLASPSDRDYGHEAVATLLKRMEDDRRRLVVIVAGYPEEMRGFLRTNVGLASRFPARNHLEFEPYSAAELAEIGSRFAAAAGYTISESGLAHVEELAAARLRGASSRFGNARWVRDILESAVLAQTDRVYDSEDLETLNTVTEDDLSDPDSFAERTKTLGFR